MRTRPHAMRRVHSLRRPAFVVIRATRGAPRAGAMPAVATPLLISLLAGGVASVAARSCGQIMQSECGGRSRAECGACVDQHQHMLRTAGCKVVDVASWCGEQPIVRTRQGYVRGTVRRGEQGRSEVAEFKGLPFALPPTGADGRFRPPRTPAQSWAGIRDATRFRPNCLSDGFGRDPQGIGDEDCLYLNVYAPAKTPSKLVPVLFWIYGGGFQGGGSNDTKLNGTWDVALAKGELVVVTSNYRVALWGWLASDHLRARDVERNSTGNYGVQGEYKMNTFVHRSWYLSCTRAPPVYDGMRVGKCCLQTSVPR